MCLYCRNLSIVLNFLHLLLSLCNMLFCHLLYRFSTCSFLNILLSFNIIFTTFNKCLFLLLLQLWQPTFPLNHLHLITQPLLSYLEQPFFFPKSMQSLSISSHTWLTLIVACHYTNIILCRPLFSDSSLMTTGPVRPNYGTPAEWEAFIIHSSLIHAAIRYICLYWTFYS